MTYIILYKSLLSLPRNTPKNRPGAPLPPASSRVKLQLVFEEVGSDYINARCDSQIVNELGNELHPQSI